MRGGTRSRSPRRPADRVGDARRTATGSVHGRARLGTVGRAGDAAPLRDQRRHRGLGPGRVRRRAASRRYAARLARAASGPGPAGYAEPGEAGLLGILPGSWGPAQTGVGDSVPSPTGDIAFWLYALDPGERDRSPCDWSRSPIRPGAAASWSALTAYRGTASPWPSSLAGPFGSSGRPPMATSRSTSVRSSGSGSSRRPLRRTRRRARSSAGTPRTGSDDGAILADLAFAPDATLTVGSTSVPAGKLPGRSRRRFER